MIKSWFNNLKDKFWAFFAKGALHDSDKVLNQILFEIDKKAKEYEEPQKLSKKQKRRENFEKFRAHKEQEKIWQQKHSQKSLEHNPKDLRSGQEGVKQKQKQYKLPFAKDTPCPEVMDHAYYRFNQRIQKISKLEMQKWFGKVWKEIMNESHDPELEPKVIYNMYKGEKRPYVKCGAPGTNKVVYLALSKSLDGVLTVLDSRCWYRNIKQERC